MSDYMRSRFTSADVPSSQVNSRLGRSRRGNGDRTRRTWSYREEEILVVALKDLVVTGWKADNGFRTGYLGRLEEALKKHYHNTDIKPTPHINSKLTSWKRFYNSLRGILSRSGVGFNLHDDYKIDYDDDQWSQIVKQDPHARYMRDKSWPFWDHWQVIFGKDRADGGSATGLMDAVTPPQAQAMETNTPPNAPVESLGNTNREKAARTTGGKKRKADHSIDGLIELLGKMNDATNARLESLSHRIGYEFDLSKSQKEVFAELGRLPGLTREQKFDAGEIILEKVERLDFFLGMPDDDRIAFLFRVLAKYGSG
ncbi:hypothetical protein SASPL_104762 [Salvia splendens]|uniref:Myb/SANT-like domain-containing protein n=1 Tax=Salvia splendens TaxID=180675 RepID=A0A8X9AAZ2_SALSN|nr:uncharacterized protein LOC121774189 [Salvia splendens]KAG6433154.1 hypothetical protein SASPL_104762 [Salvia splendens]